MRRMYSKNQIIDLIEEHGGGGSGAVASVNGKTGAVVLKANDIKLSTNQQTVQANLERIDGDITQVKQDLLDKADASMVVNLESTINEEIAELNQTKQDSLIAGANITITNNVISATGGGSGTTYLPGDGINISGNTISAKAGYGIFVDETGIRLNNASQNAIEAVATKSTVSVSSTGTATDTVSYITINGVEKKLPSGGGSGTQLYAHRIKLTSTYIYGAGSIYTTIISSRSYAYNFSAVVAYINEALQASGFVSTNDTAKPTAIVNAIKANSGQINLIGNYTNTGAEYSQSVSESQWTIVDSIKTI